MGNINDLLKVLWRPIKEWIIKEGWPWFKKEIWPIIKAEIGQIVKEVIEHNLNRLKEFLSNREKQNKTIFDDKIKAAEEKANNSFDKNEIEKQKAIVQVWREVAEMYRQQNDSLKNELQLLGKDVIVKTLKEIEEIQIDLETAGNSKINVSIGDSKKRLLLPSKMS